MIRELQVALQTLIRGNGTISAVAGGGPYLLVAPQGQALPYITHFPVDNTPIPLHSGYIETVSYQFDLWSASAVSLSSLNAGVKEALDDQTISLSTLAQVGLVRTQTFPLERETDDQGGVVLHQTIEYQIFVN